MGFATVQKMQWLISKSQRPDSCPVLVMATSVFIFTRIRANYKLSVCTSWDVLRQFNGPESEKWSMNE